ncbi:YdeI/OmpD-associated family protein [Pseudogracilibacillus auburnensis]|uniref:Bacteriocin resistance YdeI/OmpD-like protein n=1 Tax=Pseudogracilibacillus auburnensis TaxID=1494959 RepID=A0A2V3W5J7_9BACI|nr:YdeI/OmpD-associated family protein [Pseudogracilibacillus auburnensis]MBO1001694.1 YdeI/OmpD-associated family protein [Pseudogracilibacillus auburnensis]PXW89382.1 bacteriocin resistance YdeI/OmpD-like protein [Pseudogracilibacillus auburnensis]
MSIINKLKLNKYKTLAVLNEPNDYNLFYGYNTNLSGEHDAIFIFIEALDEMVNVTKRIVKEQQLLEKGYLFFAYPKKGNKRYETYIHRDEIFPAMKVDEDGYVDGSDLKFSRMVSMDDVFTVVGLKREKKRAKKSTASSQLVADYEHYVKDIERLLKDHPKERKFYQELTPGYRRDWARHIFSAKQQKTRDKRHAQMIEILSQGYKSVDLYRQNKK